MTAKTPCRGLPKNRPVVASRARCFPSNGQPRRTIAKDAGISDEAGKETQETRALKRSRNIRNKTASLRIFITLIATGHETFQSRFSEIQARITAVPTKVLFSEVMAIPRQRAVIRGISALRRP